MVGRGRRGGAIGAELPFGPLARLPRVATLLVGPDAGIVRWAPILALAAVALWLLVRSRRVRLGRMLPERREAEHAVALCLAVCGAQFAVAVLATPSVTGPWFPGRALAPALAVAVPLVAWGLRHAPRAGAVLGALTARRACGCSRGCDLRLPRTPVRREAWTECAARGSRGERDRSEVDLAPLREAREAVLGERVPVGRGRDPLAPARADPGIAVQRAEADADRAAAARDPR